MPAVPPPPVAVGAVLAAKPNIAITIVNRLVIRMAQSAMILPFLGFGGLVVPTLSL